MTELEELRLSRNNIGPDGATTLAGGIKALTELEELCLFLAWGGGVLACLSLGEAPRDLIDNLRRAGL